jgi:mono/diheme cytochrome c family protein
MTCMRLTRTISVAVAPLLISIVAVRAVAAAPPVPAPVGKVDPEGVKFFEKHIRSVLVEHCYSCHSTEAKKEKGGSRLDTSDAIRTGGETGPAVKAKDEASLLLRVVEHAPDVPAMPPKKKLSDAAIADLRAWVKVGAPLPAATIVKPIIGEAARTFWSLQPVAERPVRRRIARWRNCDRIPRTALSQKPLLEIDTLVRQFRVAVSRSAIYDAVALADHQTLPHRQAATGRWHHAGRGEASSAAFAFYSRQFRLETRHDRTGLSGEPRSPSSAASPSRGRNTPSDRLMFRRTADGPALASSAGHDSVIRR